MSCCFFFFKQKTAYELRISDWSSDVCSSDLLNPNGILIIDQRNYDAILDKGYDSKHQYYYCGDRVLVEPEHVDPGLARFRYAFPDGSEYKLNMFPLRKKYVRQLLTEAGFQRLRTYGDFQETYQEHEPDFLIHLAEKEYRHD